MISPRLRAHIPLFVGFIPTMLVSLAVTNVTVWTWALWGLFLILGNAAIYWVHRPKRS